METDRRKALNRIERMYSHSLKLLNRQILAALGNESDPQRIVRKLRQITNQPAYQQYCDSLALNFVTQINNVDARTWREAAWKASRGSDIYAAIMRELKENRYGAAFHQKVKENAKLIKTQPHAMAEDFTKYISGEALRGRRASEIGKAILAVFPEKSEYIIQRIARTETSKAQTALIQARALDLGLDWYVWRTSEDQRVRKSHGHMGGVLVRWSDPPSPERLTGGKNAGNYHAGDIYNCRCYPEPVVSLAFLDFPMKVYFGGRIQRMTRAQFEKIV